MGRRQLRPGDACRNGHPWNRSIDGKRCLTCYPNAVPFSELPVDEKLSRAERFAERRRRWVEKKAEAARAAREARLDPYNCRKRRECGRLDFAQRARRGLSCKAGPGVPTATTAELRALWDQQAGRCALTGLPIIGTPHLDHVVAVAEGGGHLISNLQWTDPRANRAKFTHSVDEFENWLLTAAESLKAKKALEELF